MHVCCTTVKHAMVTVLNSGCAEWEWYSHVSLVICNNTCILPLQLHTTAHITERLPSLQLRSTHMYPDQVLATSTAISSDVKIDA